MRAWTVREASELYGIPYWGGEYFSVSATGDVLVHPNGPGSSQPFGDIGTNGGNSRRNRAAAP